MEVLPPRLRAVADCRVAFMREYSGMHEYDGMIQDLSPDGVRRALAALGGDPLDDPLDEQVVAAAESALRVRLGELRNAHRDPSLHLEALDLACYERAYAPLEERREARRRHLTGWPAAIDAAIASLDEVPRDSAAALLPSARGLAAGVGGDDGPVGELALASLSRLVAHLERLAHEGSEIAVLGEDRLVQLVTCADDINVDLSNLQARVQRERSRMLELLADACSRLGVGRLEPHVVRALLVGYPSFAETLEAATQVVAEAAVFVAERRLVPYLEGECLVGATPAARRWAGARISWVAPREALSPAIFHITPPDPSGDALQQAAWLARFSPVTLPVVTVHETVPGHASHAIAMRHVQSVPRQVLWSELFFEGWAHYVEELCFEEGFHSGDARYQAGVAIEALVRLARVECAIGIQTGQLTVAGATEVFRDQAFLLERAAQAEAARGLFEPTYIRYALGKFLVQDLRSSAKKHWAAEFSLTRFHRELLALGSPPFGAVAPALGLPSQGPA
ncbi:MAG: DUF885 family protein [Candidatus Dormibacteria bacterium]